jgi:hypothetical protein
MPPGEFPKWERLLSSAARLQKILPEAVLVGGTAAALDVHHRFSDDADHVLTGLARDFDTILGELESVAGWKTARIRRPVLILGSLDGIETGVRQLIREEALETVRIPVAGVELSVPSLAEILRIKGVLILKRNATRDYLDFVALADSMEDAAVKAALRRFDELYPQPGGQSALQQLQIQLAKPLPFDLEGLCLKEYKDLVPRWHDWQNVEAAAARIADLLLECL